MKRTPARRTARPTGVKSNISKGGIPRSRINSLMRMFGGVPMRVVSPPSSVENARGMRSFEGGRPVRRAISITTGRRSAATPTLFMKADSAPAVSMIIAVSLTSPPAASRRTWRPRRLAIPLRARPALKMKTNMTVITAGLLKPERACFGVTRPVSASVTSISRATTSTRSFSVTKRMTATARTERTVRISGVTPRSRRRAIRRRGVREAS
jgi:hypothetical protein